jgi:hypothetical protein
MIRGKLTKNRKGAISIYILVYGILAICILVLLSFGISLAKAQLHVAAIARVVETNSFVETMEFYKNPKINRDINLDLYFSKPGEDATKSHYQFLSGTYRVSYDLTKDSEGVYTFTNKEEYCGYTGLFSCKDNLVIKRKFLA